MNLERNNLQVLNFSDASVKAGFVRRVQALDGVYAVKITKYRRRRSLQQNAFYWACVLPAICNGIAEAWGEAISADEAHLLCKQMFLSRPIINRDTGEEMAKVWPSSASLSVDQFSEYIEKIAKFAAESLSVVLPEAAA